MARVYQGEVIGKTLEIRFAYSGKVVFIGKKAGDRVTKWQTIASLDRKLLQMELDRQLADYEKARAVFEGFKLKYGPDGGDDHVKFFRAGQQAELNRSVKDVEIAKYKLDQADLVSPADGIVVSDGGLVPGIQVTPSSNLVAILDTSSFAIHFRIPQKDIPLFAQSQQGKAKLMGIADAREGKTMLLPQGKNGDFIVSFTCEKSDDLLVGMEAHVTILD